MRLTELTVPELLALANILLRIAEEIPVDDRRATREARDEIAYVLALISEKEEARPALRLAEFELVPSPPPLPSSLEDAGGVIRDR